MTKLFAPIPPPNSIGRPHLIERLNNSQHSKLTLVSAAAGFGKTTVVSQWVQTIQAKHKIKAAWLSLDKGDNDPIRFLTYMVAALQTIDPKIGTSLLSTLQSAQPPPPEAILVGLVNEMSQLSAELLLVLDDYHILDNPEIDQAIIFLLENMPPPMHLVMISREDPSFPLSRMRVRGELTELREADLRFTAKEAADFFNAAMGLSLALEDILALEQRTEGWIAGLQLAALSLQGQDPHHTAEFIQNFSGSHRFVLDYLTEEVLAQQPDNIRQFMLNTSILDRINGPLCDAVMGDNGQNSQQTLEFLERSNLFIIPLDHERGWYRYHHLFGDLLRQRLNASLKNNGDPQAQRILHQRASDWFKAQGLDLEGFKHATAAADFERAIALIRGNGMPLQFRGGAPPIISWLKSLPTAELDARPELWVTWASSILMLGKVKGVEEKVRAAEVQLEAAPQTPEIRDLIGRIASVRATVAVTQHQIDRIVWQGERALEYLLPANLPVRTSIKWALGYAHQLTENRDAAMANYQEAVQISAAIGHNMIDMMAHTGLGEIQEAQLEYGTSFNSRQRAIELAGDPPLPSACDVFLGIGRMHYAQNALDKAREFAEISLKLAQQIAYTDRFLDAELFLAKLKLAQGLIPLSEAVQTVKGLAQTARQQNFTVPLPRIMGGQVALLLLQDEVAAAEKLAKEHNLPISQAQVALAQNDPQQAIEFLRPVYDQAVTNNWRNVQLESGMWLALAFNALGDEAQAVDHIGRALTLAAPSKLLRHFVDAGQPMQTLLKQKGVKQLNPTYVNHILAVFGAERPLIPAKEQGLVEPLSPRELEILALIAEGLSNKEIGERLYLALNTVKGHNRNIFGKLQVQRRTEAVARARELNLVSD